MKKLKELMKSRIAIGIGAVLLVAIIVLIVALIVTGGDKSTKSKKGEKGTETGENLDNVSKGAYTVSVKTQGGMAMSGLDVYVYADDSLSDLKVFAATNENGIVTFDLPESDKYAITITGAPKGYNVKESYSFTDKTAVISLSSSIITDGDISGAKLGLGDVMYDMTVTTSDGQQITISELLKEKKMVMLNFWYTTCQYCVEEFPFMEEAYKKYKNDIEIVALNHLDDVEAIKSFKSSMGLTFPMATCNSTFPQNVFGVSGWPTSVVIDRYGVVCMIEAGGILSLRPFINMFDHFTAEDYQQKLCVNGIGDLVTNVKPTYTMDTTENISAAINKGDINVTYRPETDEEDAEYSWPFIIGEKDGEKVIYASNQQIDGSFAIIYADVELKAGEALGFDYLASTEYSNDILHVIVNGEAIYTISGDDEKKTWKSCYPCVADVDGTYEVALCYIKDDGTNVGDDTVYIKNMRIVGKDKIDAPTYIPREAATSKDGFEFEYVTIVYNEKDGYYHVGTANGPLLLADLMNTTTFNEETSVHDLTVNGDITLEDGRSIYEELVDFCSYSSNSSLYGVCPVNKELADLLKIVGEKAGFDENDSNEWLKLCKYYQAYGTKGEQLVDPIKGLAPFSAYKATLGKNVSTNYFYYDRIIMPRGMFAEFIPNKSGVYRITSRTDSGNDVDGWIFDENRKELLTFENDERMFPDMNNVSMVFYMEAGKKYYINIAFWDMYEVGNIYYDIEYVASEIQHFRLCSQGYFTYDSDATGNEMYHVIAGGITPILGSDGKYYEDLGKDANGKQKYGSLIYADFVGTTGIFSTPIINDMINKGAFDFTKTEGDLLVLSFLTKNNNDIDAAKKELKEYWGDDYDYYYEHYLVDEVFAGKYHGEGQDLTNEIKEYAKKIDKSSNTERNGCVVVDKRLAEILQMVMEKYTFENVDHAWLKLCYYYDYIGPKAQ